MSQVKFVIEGDIKSALKALDDFNKKLTAVAANPAIRGLQATFNGVVSQVSRANAHLSQMNRLLAQVRGGAGSLGSGLNGVVRNTIRINANTTTYVRNVTRAQTQTQQLTQQTTRLNTALGHVATTAAKVGLAISKGFSKAAIGFRGSVGSGLGGIQSLGIGVRMSGIALGNQLAQIMGGSLSGNFLSPVLNALKGAINTSVGLVNIGAQMATRIVTGLAGTITKMIGPVVGGAVNAVVGSLGAGIALSSQGVTKLLGATLVGIGDVVQNVASGITQFAGEIVIQVGNIFTGLTEVLRGAFQAAVNVAAGILNGLVGIASAVAERVAGVLGKALAGVVGGALTVGGIALKDRAETESAVTGATVLFSDKVSPQEKRAFRKKVMALRHEFPTLAGESIGKAAEMLVSTGFQDDPRVAQDFLRGLLPVAEVSNLQNLPELARTAAKVYNLFRDEIDAAAKKDGTGAGEFLAGRLFQVRNVGDLEISDLATHLGEAAGVGKAFGLTLDETLEQLAQLSLGLAPDETFTAFRSIITRLQDPAKETRELFADLGVELKQMTPETEAQLAAINAERKSLEQQVATLEKKKGKHKEIAALKKQMKALDDSESKVLRGARSRNPLDIVSDLLSRNLSEEEMAIAFPNVRGLKGIAVQKALTEDSKEMVRAGLRGSAKAQVASGRGERQEDLAFKFADIWAKAKEPFDDFFTAVEPTLKKFLDDTSSTFKRFGDFVRSALADSGAAEFAANLGDKLAPVFAPLVAGFEALLATDPSAFWAAMTTGVNATARAIEGAIGFFQTVGGLIGDVVGAVPGIREAWDAVSGFFGSVGEGIEKVSKGDRSPIIKVFSDLNDALAGLISDGKTMLAGFLADLAGMVERLKDTILGIMDSVVSSASGVLGGLAAFFGMNALKGLGGGAGAVAGGGAPGAAAAGVAGAAGAGGFGRGFARGFGGIAAPVMAFHLGSQIASGSAPATAGGTAVNVLGGAASGAAIGSGIAPGVGTLAGGLIGALLGLLPDLLGSSEQAPSAEDTAKSQDIAALRLAIQTGTIFDSSTRRLRPNTGTDDEQALAMLGQRKELLRLEGGDNFVGGLARDLIDQQIDALVKSIEAENRLSDQMEQWASGSLRGWLMERADSMGGSIGGISDASTRETLAAQLRDITQGLRGAATAEEAAPFRKALDELAAKTGATLSAESKAAQQRDRMTSILDAIANAVSQEGAQKALGKLGVGPENLSPEQKAQVRALPSGVVGRAAELQKFLDMMRGGGGAAGAAAGLMPGVSAEGVVIRDGKAMAKGEAASRDRVKRLAQGLNQAASDFDLTKPKDWSANDKAVADEDSYRKQRLAGKMGLKVGPDGSMISPGEKPKQKGLIQRDEQGRPYVEGQGGKRKYLTTAVGNPFAGGKALKDMPEHGAFGFRSGRALAESGKSGFMGFGAQVQPGSLENKLRQNARKALEAGGVAAGQGNMKGAGEGAKVGSDILKSMEDGQRVDQQLLDVMKQIIDAMQKNVAEQSDAVAEHAEGTAESIETMSETVQDLRNRLKAIEDRERGAAEATR